jgi:hypothetical protein
MTSLFKGTPEAAIWKRALLGHWEEEVVRRLEQVVYSAVPSVASINTVILAEIDGYPRL